MEETIIYWGKILGMLVFLIILTLNALFIVEQQTFKVVERLGKFKGIYRPGLSFKIPFVDRIAGENTLRIQQLEVDVETKTSDNVFVKVQVSVQFHILEEKAFEAFYKLKNPRPQITSYVFDTVRATVPTLSLDEVFVKKDDIATAVTQELKDTMDDFGYFIVKSLVTDIDPDAKVKESMNEINAQKRLRVAAEEKGEGEKILVVKAAEAEAESKKLQGEGIAKQRRAIIDGLKQSVEDFGESVEGSTPQDVMNLVLLTQYFDTLKDIGGSSRSNVLLLPSSPGGMADFADQIQRAILVGKGVPTQNG